MKKLRIIINILKSNRVIRELWVLVKNALRDIAPNAIQNEEDNPQQNEIPEQTNQNEVHEEPQDQNEQNEIHENANQEYQENQEYQGNQEQYEEQQPQEGEGGEAPTGE